MIKIRNRKFFYISIIALILTIVNNINIKGQENINLPHADVGNNLNVSFGDTGILDTEEVIGIPDQVNENHTWISWGCGFPPMGLGSLFQSFIPSYDTLIEVELLLRAGGSFPQTGYSTTINIRSNDPWGTVLGSANAFVPGPLTAGALATVQFSFPTLISLTPGLTYIIEWNNPPEGAVILTWMGSDTNPYPNGNAFNCYGTPIQCEETYPNVDFVFKTYAMPVIETDKPIIINSPSNFTVILGYSDVNISWTATDVNPDLYSIELEGSGTVAGPASWSSGVEITYNVPDGLGLGEYLYTVNFTDYFGNYAADTIKMTVQEVSTNGFGIPFGNYYLVFLIFGIIILTIVQKRKRL